MIGYWQFTNADPKAPLIGQPQNLVPHQLGNSCCPISNNNIKNNSDQGPIYSQDLATLMFDHSILKTSALLIMPPALTLTTNKFWNELKIIPELKSEIPQ